MIGPSQRIRRLAVLAAGVTAMGSAAVLVRLAEEAPALTIAAYRLLIAGGLLGAVALWLGISRRHRWPSGHQQLLILAAGGFLAAHFWAWFASIERTSVGSSVVLVATQPLLAALLGYAAFRELPSRAEWQGLAIAGLGVLVVGGRDFIESPGSLAGNGLALLGAGLVASYHTIGRGLRVELSASMYSGLVYAVAAAWLWLLVAVFRPEITGFGTDTWVYMALLALGPQLIGHTSINWSLGHFRVVTVGLAIAGEPVVSTFLAIPALGEWPSLGVLLGGPLIIAGVVVGLRGSSAAAARGSTLALAETGNEREITR